ncbi:hypothetical protein [Streptomyces winkii]|uniref:hypothetical protein n=1 Tax=Streptomyces winkii TaxID=3051178 RepID=UPI0028D71148|nr:hypothetical protein [Streptomyces sp. DSM 40971]
MAEGQKAMAWIGVAASAVAVLAFFGITSFDELRNAIDPAGASSDACEQAAKATQELRDKEGSNDFDGSEAFGDYAPKIRSAAGKAGDQKLKSLMLDDADAAEDMADEYARNDTYSVSSNNRLAAARNQWTGICDKSS